MSNLYSLHAKVVTLAPIKSVWQFKLCAALLSRSFEQEEIVDESNDEVLVSTVTADRIANSYLKENEVFVGSLPIVPGVTVITADTQGGKTTTAISIINALAEIDVATAWITLQETSKVSPFFSSLSSLADTLAAVEHLPDVIVIDSFRLTQFGISGGSTRAGGVSSKLFELLTELNNAAELAGIALIVLFNPMAKDEVAAEILNRDTKSSVNQVLTLSSPGQGYFTSRIADDRGDQPFSLAQAVKQRATSVDVINVKSADMRKKPFNVTSNLDIY